MGTEELVRLTTYAVSPLLHMHIPGVRIVTWVIAFAVPLVWLVTFALTLRRTVDRPADFVAGRGALATVVGLTITPLVLAAAVYVARGYAWDATSQSFAYLHGIFALRHAVLGGMPVLAAFGAALAMHLRGTEAVRAARVTPCA